MTNNEPEPLRPMLESVQSELVDRLDEACGHDVEDESTSELMKLEEALVDAAHAAKQAVSLRRRLSTGHGPTGARMSGEGSAVREFRDRLGVVWRVWAVKPGKDHPDSRLAGKLGEFTEGWLAFETEDGSQRRRLPHYPEGWCEQTNDALEALLERAETVQRKRRGSAGDSDTSRA